MAAAPPPTTSRRRRGAGHGHPFPYLPALDGVRAVAVAGVVAYHAGVKAVPAGFLGVDAFFVLSGFLITGLMLAEWDGTGRVRLGAFWARRGRRLLPALVLVLAFVLVVSAVGGWAEPPTQLRGDVLATLFYVSNWHQIAVGTNYFVSNGPVSPLTHTWSLAVEEQFYLCWPLIVLAVLVVARRRRRRPLGGLLVLCVVGALASAVEMARLYRPVGDITRLYYGTDTHAQSLLVGAALAVALTAWANRRPAPVPDLAGSTAAGGDRANPFAARSRWGRRTLDALGLVGAVGAAVLWTQVHGQSGFLYRGGFLLDSVAAGLVLWSVAGAERGLAARALLVAPVRYVGRISYGIYLWHFPLFLLLDAARTGLHGPALLAVRLGATLVVAVASFHLVEQPVRRGTRLRRAAARVATPAVAAALVAGAFLVTTGAAASPGLATADTDRPVAAPTPDPVRVLMVGDSMAETLGNGLEGAVAASHGAVVDNQGDPNCSLAMGVFQVQDYPPRQSAPPCQPGSGDPGWPTDWAHDVDTFRPDVSVFLARLDIMDRLLDNRWTHIGDPAYDRYLLGQMRLAVRVLSAGGGKVVFLTTPYYDSGEQPDGAPWPEDDPQRVDRYNAMLRTVAAEYPGTVSVVDLNAVADPGGHYQADIDGVQVRYSDGVHWTTAGDDWLAPRILPAIVAAGRSATPSVDLTGVGG